jgi:hypothetical protein
MVTEALLVICVILSALAVVLCVVIIYRSGRTASGIPPILDQRFLSIEGAIGRSDASIRDEFGRDREEGREAARSLREEVTGLFERLAGKDPGRSRRRTDATQPQAPPRTIVA